MKTQSIRFLKNGEAITLHEVPANRTLLEVLREDLHCTGTKEGCGEGDCGACTVVIGQERDGKLHTSAINSCIRLAHSVDGLAVWTVEGLTQDNGAPHPVQEALKTSHASQCGFCTPGFAMSLFGLYQK
ncbi:MAG: 2Fe-2S iron-sulfur cluster-binding protein, partial [Comamonadaceae bacterium]